MAVALKRIACEEIDRYSDDLYKLSQEIWARPELNFEEHFAHQVLTDFLEKHGFLVEKHFKLETAFRATWGSDAGNGPHVAVLCEYDALPEIGHACGHNLIAEVGVAAGLGIKAAMQTATTPLGKLTVLGTPAEEGGGGKIKLIKANVFDDMDVAMMAHPAPFSKSQPPGLASLHVTVTYRGKASHASAFPWEGVNALDSAVMCYQSISNLRQQFKPSRCVNGIITKGGTKPNIIPDQTELLFSIRAPTDSDLLILKDKVFKCFDAAAIATGCTVETKVNEEPYATLIHNKPLVDAYATNVISLGGVADDYNELGKRLTVSTDMGNVSHVVPTIHPSYSVGSGVLNHTHEFTAIAGNQASQPYTIKQGKALAMTAIDVLTSPELLAKITADFTKAIMPSSAY